MKVYKEVKRINDTIYGYNYNAMGELVLFITKMILAEKKILKIIPYRKEVIESMSALALPTELNFYLIEISKKIPIDTDEDGIDIYFQQDMEELKEVVNKKVIDLYENNPELAIIIDKLKKDRTKNLNPDNVLLNENLKKQGWTNIWNIKDYTVKKSYWLRNDKYNNIQVGVVRYSRSQSANGKFDILGFDTYALPGDVMDCIFKKETGGDKNG